jgi:SAM-dependent methyltransferase
VADASRFRFTTIAHTGRALLGPLSAESVEELLSRVTFPARDSRPTVLDVGCGKGEVLLRAMRRFGATGTGVDPNEAFLAEARERAAVLGLADSLTLHACTLAELSVPVSPADVAVCTGSTHAFGDLDAALHGLQALVREGGRALVGTGFWRRPPDAEYLAFLGAKEEEMAPLDETLAAPGRAGWAVEVHHESSAREWDDYEGSYAAAVSHWLIGNPAEPEAAAFGARIAAWKQAYTRWGRDSLGFTTMLLRRPEMADNPGASRMRG